MLKKPMQNFGNCGQVPELKGPGICQLDILELSWTISKIAAMPFSMKNSSFNGRVSWLQNSKVVESLRCSEKFEIF